MAVNVFVHQHGETTCTDRVEPAWLDPASGATVWVDLTEPAPADERLLSDIFKLHPLSVEDALSAIQYPKVEPYDGYLYVILHGIDARAGERHVPTRDVDFFLGPNFLLSVHDGHSRSIARVRSVCARHGHLLAEGPVALLHHIVDGMVDNYQPAIEAVEQRIGSLEEQAYTGHDALVRQVLRLRQDLAETRRVLVPQRDVIGRLARREFPQISSDMAYRFRDVYDHVVRLTEEATLLQDRVTGILEVNLAAISNRLNQVMKLLTVMSTIFLPLSVLTSMWGMNIALPALPGGPAAQFWWLAGIMVVIVAGMLAVFRRFRWL